MEKPLKIKEPALYYAAEKMFLQGKVMCEDVLS